MPTASSATRAGRVETCSAAEVCADYGVELPEIRVGCGSPFIGGYHPVTNANNQDRGTLVHRELRKENHA